MRQASNQAAAAMMREIDVLGTTSVQRTPNPAPRGVLRCSSAVVTSTARIAEDEFRGERQESAVKLDAEGDSDIDELNE